MTHYIGLDGHSETSMFVVIDDNAKLTSKPRVPTTEKYLLSFVRSVKGPKKLVLEESHVSQWLYLLLKDEVDDLVVCNPGYLGRRPGGKDDFKDALHLANELRCGHLVAVHHEDSELWTLRSLVQAYADITQQLTQAKNRFKAIFRAQAIVITGSKAFHDETFLKQLTLPSDVLIAKNLLSQIAHLENTKASYKGEFERYAKQHKQIKRLCSVPGISLIRATIIAAMVCSPMRFKNKHKFWAYSMLIKYVNTSDNVVYGKSAVRGRRELKAVFDGAALTVLKGENALRKYYDDLRKKGVPHKAAKKAVARKIAAICLAILKGQEKYSDIYEVKRDRLTETV